MIMADGNWFQTYTGKAWRPLNPNPDDVCIEDIAHGLALQCRFNGQCREFYSIAEHSVRVSDELRNEGIEIALAGLLHDAAEAYLGDIVRPVKRNLPQFHSMERANLGAIFAGLGLGLIFEGFADRITEMDLIMLATERRDLMTDPPMPWVGVEDVEPLPGQIAPLSPFGAESRFLGVYHDLRAAAGGL
jgi:hypothetical protein